MSPSDDAEARLRRVEEAVIRLEERGRAYDSLVPAMADVKGQIANLWVQVGQMKVKQAGVWVLISTLAGIISSLVTKWV